MKTAQRVWTVIWVLIAIAGLIGAIWNPAHIFTAFVAFMLALITMTEHNENDD